MPTDEEQQLWSDLQAQSERVGYLTGQHELQITRLEKELRDSKADRDTSINHLHELSEELRGQRKKFNYTESLLEDEKLKHRHAVADRELADEQRHEVQIRLGDVESQLRQSRLEVQDWRRRYFSDIRAFDVKNDLLSTQVAQNELQIENLTHELRDTKDKSIQLFNTITKSEVSTRNLLDICHLPHEGGIQDHVTKLLVYLTANPPINPDDASDPKVVSPKLEDANKILQSLRIKLKVERDDLIGAKLDAMITSRNASDFIFYTLHNLLGTQSNSLIVEEVSKKLESLRESTDIVSNISQKLNQLDGSDLSGELDSILQGRQNDRIRITQLESDVQQLHAKEQRLVSVQASLSRISYILGISENYNVDDNIDGNDDDDIDDDDAVIINGVQELHNSKASLEDRIQSAEFKIVKLREKMQSRKTKLKLSNESYKRIYDENREVREKLGGGLVSVLPALAENVMQELGNLSDEMTNIRNAFGIQPEITMLEYVNSVFHYIDDIRIALNSSADADILLCIKNRTQRTTDLEHELSQAGKALELPRNKSLVIWAGNIKAERNAYKLENNQLIQRVETLEGDDTNAKSTANDLETQLNAAQQAAQFDPDKHDTLPDAINLFKKEISDTADFARETLVNRGLCSAGDIYTTNECIAILLQQLERASSLNASLATVVGSGDADIMVHTKFIMSRISDLDAITNSIRARLNLNDGDGTTPVQAVNRVLADLANANQVAERVINVMIALKIDIPHGMTTSQGIDIISTRLRGCKDAADEVLSMVMRHMTDFNIVIPHSTTSLQGIEMISRSLTSCLDDAKTLRDALLSSLVEFGIPHTQDVSAKKAMSLINEKLQEVKAQLENAATVSMDGKREGT
jgi:flagellin-specific chaperone FliS